MNTVNFKIVKSFIRSFLFSFCFFAQVKVHAFDIDLSRRANEIKDITSIKSSAPPQDAVTPAPVEKPTDSEIMQALKNVVMPVDASKEIVILQTENGFVPSMVQVKKGEVYKIHVVNLNMKEKNVSFLMDAFTQSYNTVYGTPKTFTIEPKVEGVFSYQCPETGVQGKLVVIPDAPTTKRKVASDE
ncbi:MAG: cupredoxin domain-containing protein [Bdellovibrio sp.]|nr:cupredoxin domain-containing protein [Bdellovibrio sp.]